MKLLTLLSLWLLTAMCLGTNSFAGLSNSDDSGVWMPYSFGSSPTLKNVGNSFTANFPASSQGGPFGVIAG